VLKQIFFWAALIWTFVIALLCLASSGDLPKVGFTYVDKYAHLAFHFVFTGLWFLYFNHKKYMSSNAKTILIVFLLSVFYGIALEILQELFTSTRMADVFDVLANVTGAIVAVISIRLCQKYTKRKSL
jgi:VanZ family protein